MTDLLQLIRTAGQRHGLNLVGAIPIARYEDALGPKPQLRAAAPEARSIIVIGSGGGGWWLALKQYAAQHPGWFEREHPMDDFTRVVIEGDIVAPIRALGLCCSATYPFIQDRSMLNFVELGKLAGLGGPSIIGVLVHPKYGPWIAFRAALLVDADLDAAGDAVGFDPCPRCVPRSCIAACPVGAVSYPKGWDIPRCLEHRVEAEPDCALRCHARVGCVLGPEHRYPDDELAYHQGRALGAMRPYYREHVKKS